MSTLRGTPDSAWTLPQAADAMAESARQAGRPGGIWLAGLGYQILNLGWTFGALIGIPMIRAALPEMNWFGGDVTSFGPFAIHWRRDLLHWIMDAGPWVSILYLPIILILFRFVTGLARISTARDWQVAAERGHTPRLRKAWFAGRGQTRATVGLWLQIVLMMLGAILLFVGPAQLLVSLLHLTAFFSSLLAGVALALVFVYSFILSILFQIALHSLVQNRRGAGSALLHAWRIARNDPMATARATAVDAVLYVTVLVLISAAVLSLSWLSVYAVAVLAALLDAFAGCTRCAYWARAYRALGGLSTLEGTPGG